MTMTGKYSIPMITNAGDLRLVFRAKSIDIGRPDKHSFCLHLCVVVFLT